MFDEYDGNGKVVYESIVGDDLEKRGLNMIYNVGKGASSPPRLVIVEYIGAPKSKEKIALVGKINGYLQGRIRWFDRALVKEYGIDALGLECIHGHFDWL